MHIVAASSDTAQVLDSLLTARASREQLSQLSSQMERPGDLSAPGPAGVVTVELSTGHRATVVYHERKGFVEILAPLERGLEVGLADILVELKIAPEAITWIHERLDKQALLECKVIALVKE